jgi:hypothetical protein
MNVNMAVCLRGNLRLQTRFAGQLRVDSHARPDQTINTTGKAHRNGMGVRTMHMDVVLQRPC